jgi:cytochrome P450
VHAVFDVIRPLPFRFPRRLRHRLEKELDDLDKYLGRLIDQRSAEPPRNDFLGLLLSGTEHYAPLSRQAILDESVTMLLAGHETTTSALVWSLYLLARHPQCAEVLAADLNRCLSGEAPRTEISRSSNLCAPYSMKRCAFILPRTGLPERS